MKTVVGALGPPSGARGCGVGPAGGRFCAPNPGSYMPD